MAGRRSAVATAAAVLMVAGCTSAAPGPTRSATSSSPSSAGVSPSTSASATPAVSTARPVSTAPSPSPSRRVAPVIPPVSDAARAAGLRDVRTVVPDARIDLRYATSDNFTGVRLYPRDARCLVHRSMTTGLARVARAVRAAGLVLVFWDCYRPHPVQVRMFEIVANPVFVARPGPYARSHEAGRSVDVTLARRSTGQLLDMGTGFDSFTDRAAAYATDVSATARRHRALLRKLMGTGGFGVYPGEWWHFDGRGADIDRPYLNAPVR